MPDNENSDVVRIHWKQAIIVFTIGCVLGMAGLRALSPYVPWLGEVVERQQKEICGQAIGELVIANMKTSIVLEKRLSSLEATLKAHGIEVPEAE